MGKKYSVQFSNLKVGEHTFELEVGKEFFDDFPYSEIKQGDVKATIKLVKRTNMMLLEINIAGTVHTLCDRCASDMDLPIHFTQTAVVKTGEQEKNEEDSDEDIIYISSSDSEIDLKQHLYEYIILSLPIKREHLQDKDCDHEVISRLDGVASEEEEEDDTNDPRWEGLKKLKLN